MSKTLLVYLLLFCFLFFSCQSNEQKGKADKPDYAIVIHGGAGTILKKNMTDSLEMVYRAALNKALDIGENILTNGGKSIDAVEQTIKYLEDNPLFNAGKGAVFTHNETNEMDASIMLGHNQMAGAVGGVSRIKNPISAARAVMEKTKHVMLVGNGAEEFAASTSIEMVDPSYFYTQDRYQSLMRIKNEDLGQVRHNPDNKFGTVGCVALDINGNIVAGTSTGGMTNKRYNRIGDSPIIGAGTYADNASCGVSSTGHGEYFIRYAVAHDISARMKYKGISLQEAAEQVIMQKLVDEGGSGGVVALDTNANIAMVFNTAGMYRAYTKKGERVVKIYKEE